MPCYLAVSIAKCAVSEERLLSLLTPDVVQQAVLAYAQEQYAAAAIGIQVLDKTVYCSIGRYRVAIENGQVRVNASTGNQAFAQTLATNFTELVRRLAESLFQKQVQHVLQSLSTRPVQAQVVQVNNAGRQEQATLFTLHL
jgi:glutathione synthase/RimK-type ligase-like ATP-grasp enzyme